jgi:hypothetical protein
MEFAFNLLIGFGNIAFFFFFFFFLRQGFSV